MLNINEIIEPSPFFSKLYPDGINNLSIHKIDFMTTSHGSSFVYIYTNEKPKIDVPKYGVWGEDYNTIVIELSCRISVLEISGSSQDRSYLPIEIYCNETSGYTLKQSWTGGGITLHIDSKFIFQRISTYFSE